MTLGTRANRSEYLLYAHTQLRVYLVFFHMPWSTLKEYKT